MVKTLICGDIQSGEQWELLLKRLDELQKSANGPFDLLFLCGKYNNIDNFKISEFLQNEEFPIQTIIALNKSSCGDNSLFFEKLRSFKNIDFIGWSYYICRYYIPIFSYILSVHLIEIHLFCFCNRSQKGL